MNRDPQDAAYYRSKYRPNHRSKKWNDGACDGASHHSDHRAG